MSDDIKIPQLRMIGFGHDDVIEPDEEGLEQAADISKLALDSESDEDFINRRKVASKLFGLACGVIVHNEDKYLSRRGKEAGKESHSHRSASPLWKMCKAIMADNQGIKCADVAEELAKAECADGIKSIKWWSRDKHGEKYEAELGAGEKHKENESDEDSKDYDYFLMVTYSDGAQVKKSVQGIVDFIGNQRRKKTASL